MAYPFEHNIGGITSGRKTCGTAGTAERLVTTATAAKYIIVTAERDNTNVVAVGGSGVIAATATCEGTPLYPGDSASFMIDDVMDVYLDSITNGEGVTYNYFTEV